MKQCQTYPNTVKQLLFANENILQVSQEPCRHETFMAMNLPFFRMVVITTQNLLVKISHHEPVYRKIMLSQIKVSLQ